MSDWTHVSCEVKLVMSKGKTLNLDKDLGRELNVTWEKIDPDKYMPRAVRREGGWDNYRKNHTKKEYEAMDDKYWAERKRRQKVNMRWMQTKEYLTVDDAKWKAYHKNPKSFMPVGSEGGCKRKMYKCKTKYGDCVYTIKIYGNLRDYASTEGPIEYFKEKIRRLSVKTEMIYAKVISCWVSQEQWEFQWSTFDYDQKYYARRRK